MVTITLGNGTQVSVPSNEDAIAILNGLSTQGKPAELPKAEVTAATTTAQVSKPLPYKENKKPVQGEFDFSGETEEPVGETLGDANDQNPSRGYYWDAYLANIAPAVVECTNLTSEHARKRFIRQFCESKISFILSRGGHGGKLCRGFSTKYNSVQKRTPEAIRKAVYVVARRMYQPTSKAFHNPDVAGEQLRDICRNFVQRKAVKKVKVVEPVDAQ